MTDSATPGTAPGGHDWARLRREVVRDAAAVGVAVGTYGVAYGALGTTSGLSVAQTCTLSVLAFTGGSQFALVGVLGAGGAAASGVATALMLGFRNSLYGLRLAPTLQVSGVRRLLAAHLVIDETTAMTIAQPRERAARLAFWATGRAVYTLGNIATVVGALGASALGDPNRFGLDAAVPAAFLGLLWPRLGSRTTRAVAIGAAVVALALTPVLSPGIPVLVAGLVAVAVGLARPSSALEAS
ncbi:MAG: AzlC family ABC transporter permease [Actinomycetes bacterium]